MIDAELLAMLCCPESRQDLRLAEAGEVAKLNEAIRAGQLRNRGGQPVGEAIDGALVRADGRWAYPIRDGIPVMLIDEALPGAGLAGG